MKEEVGAAGAAVATRDPSPFSRLGEPSPFSRLEDLSPLSLLEEDPELFSFREDFDDLLLFRLVSIVSEEDNATDPLCQTSDMCLECLHSPILALRIYHY